MKIRILPLVRKEIPLDEEGNRVLLNPLSITGISGFALPEDIKAIEYRPIKVPLYDEEGNLTGYEDGEYDYHIDLYLPYLSRSEWPSNRNSYLDREELFDPDKEPTVIVGLTEEEVLIKNEQEKQNLINQEAREYLTSTDWYLARKFETGKDVPEEVLLKRQEARDSVKEENLDGNE